MGFLADVRLAARQLRAAPGYAVAAVTILALAIGASTAIFSAVDAVLLAPMPLRQPEHLAVAWGESASLAMRVVELSCLDIRDLGEATPEIGAVASVGSSPWNVVLDGQGESVRLAASGVSGTFFEVVGAAPYLGRLIRPDDDRSNAAPVVVLSHGAWQQRFGGDPAIVGRTMQLDDQPSEVIGVMPAGFDYPRGTELWTPIVPVLAPVSTPASRELLRDVGLLFMVSRLNPGVTPGAAARAWTRAMARLKEGSAGPARPALWALSGAVGPLLLIACANVSGLMLTRVSQRRHDAAIRLAIGGSRVAIARLWAAESLWLAVCGGVLGVFLARWLIAAIRDAGSRGHPAARRRDPRSARDAVQHRGHGRRHAPVRRRADAPRRPRQPHRDAQRRQSHGCRRTRLPHAFHTAGRAGRPGRRVVDWRGAGRAQLRGAAAPRSWLRRAGTSADEGGAARLDAAAQRVAARSAAGDRPAR